MHHLQLKGDPSLAPSHVHHTSASIQEIPPKGVDQPRAKQLSSVVLAWLTTAVCEPQCSRCGMLGFLPAEVQETQS